MIVIKIKRSVKEKKKIRLTEEDITELLCLLKLKRNEQKQLIAYTNSVLDTISFEVDLTNSEEQLLEKINELIELEAELEIKANSLQIEIDCIQNLLASL